MWEPFVADERTTLEGFLDKQRTTLLWKCTGLTGDQLARQPVPAEFGPQEMRQWYRPQDLLASINERVIPETSALNEAVSLILAETKLQANHAGDVSPGRTVPATSPIE